MKRILFLKPAVNFLLLGLLITSLSRISLFFLFRERAIQTENYWLIFPIGLRMDIILLSYILVLPTFLICLLPDKYLQFIKKIFSIYFIFFLFLPLFMELATRDFINEYDTKPNDLVVDYLIQLRDVIGTTIEKLFIFYHSYFSYTWRSIIFYY